MKTIPFTKMAGAGNDFIVVEACPGVDYKELAVKVCDRTNGIGADGLLVLEKSKKADHKMRIINRDGSEAEMCGNGGRCMAAYIVRYRKSKKKLFAMETAAGLVRAKAAGEKAAIELGMPSDYKADMPITVNGRSLHVSFINTGVPHAVIFVEGLKNIAVGEIGRVIRWHDAFEPKGTNVNFVEQIQENEVNVRTYERGVEAETKACGTGSVAAAIVAYLRADPAPADQKNVGMKVHTEGGEMLEVSFDIIQQQVVHVWLKGSAHFIAKGEYYV